MKLRTGRANCWWLLALVGLIAFLLFASIGSPPAPPRVPAKLPFMYR